MSRGRIHRMLLLRGIESQQIPNGSKMVTQMNQDHGQTESGSSWHCSGSCCKALQHSAEVMLMIRDMLHRTILNKHGPSKRISLVVLQ